MEYCNSHANRLYFKSIIFTVEWGLRFGPWIPKWQNKETIAITYHNIDLSSKQGLHSSPCSV